jgi:glucose dehydrogenase
VLVVPAVHFTVGFDAATGEELWRYSAPLDTVDAAVPAPGEVRRATIEANGETVFIPAWGGSVSAVDLQTGMARWVWHLGPMASDTASPGVFRSGAEGVTVSGDTVYVGGWHSLDRAGVASETWLVALDAVTGTEYWRIVIPTFSGGVSVYGAPKVFGRLVIFSPLVGYTWAFDRLTREEVWSYVPRPYHATTVGPELYGDVLYVDVGDDSLVALGAADGEVRWKARIGGSTYHGLLVTERRIYIPWGQRLAVLDRASGRRLADATQPGRTYDSYIASAPAAANGRVFINVEGAAWSFDEP